MNASFDIIIIGAGVLGTALARELSKYEISIALLEKNDDVSDEVSKANSGIVHAGFDDKPGSVKSQFCVSGNKLFAQLQSELSFGYRPMPSMVLGFSPSDNTSLEQLVERGRQNGLNDIVILNKHEAMEREPELNEHITSALYCGESGLVSPYEYGIALAENAIQNGVNLYLGQKVIAIEKISEKIRERTQKFIIRTEANEEFETRVLVNAAGLYANAISHMLDICDYTITPRKGQYVLYDRGTGDVLSHILFQCPTEKGKGVLVTPTYHGNLLVGPNSTNHDDKSDVNTDLETLINIINTGLKSVKSLPKRPIRSYAGNRPISSTGDFIVRASEVQNFFELAGMASPGLTASYAIAKFMTQKIVDTYALTRKQGWHANRRAIIVPNFKKNFLSHKEMQPYVELTQGNPERMVCRCEQVREGTIRDACQRGIPLASTDAVKRRTRAGMGACQGTFCQARVRAILSEYNQVPEEEILQHGNTPEPQKATMQELMLRIK